MTVYERWEITSIKVNQDQVIRSLELFASYKLSKGMCGSEVEKGKEGWGQGKGEQGGMKSRRRKTKRRRIRRTVDKKKKEEKEAV